MTPRHPSSFMDATSRFLGLGRRTILAIALALVLLAIASVAAA